MKPEWIVSAIGLAIGCLGLGYGLGQRRKMHDISYKIDKSIDEITESDKIDISETLVEKAVEKAARAQAKDTVERLAKTVMRDIEKDISAQVSKAVGDAYNDIRTSVEKETAKRVARIDIEDLKRQVIKQAKDEASSKLKGSLDDILEDFNRNLKTVSDVYSSLGKAFSPAKDVKLSIG